MTDRQRDRRQPYVLGSTNCFTNAIMWQELMEVSPSFKFYLLLIFLWGKSTGPFNPDGKGPYLFDLEEDPGETNNIAKQNPEVVQNLEKLMHEYRKFYFYLWEYSVNEICRSDGTTNGLGEALSRYCIFSAITGIWANSPPSERFLRKIRGGGS